MCRVLEEMRKDERIECALEMHADGMPYEKVAKKSTDMQLKCQYLSEINDGRGIVFATGTPISNTMCVRP